MTSVHDDVTRLDLSHVFDGVGCVPKQSWYIVLALAHGEINGEMVARIVRIHGRIVPLWVAQEFTIGCDYGPSYVT